MLKTTSVGHIRRQHVSLHICTSSADCFYPKSLFTVHCTAFSLHICLFTHGVILLESATLSSEDEEDVSVSLILGGRLL